MSTVREDVDRGLVIVKELAALDLELKAIEGRLHKAGLEAGTRGEHKDLKDEDRGGKQWLAKGTEVEVPLIFTDDKIRASFTANGAIHQTIRNAAHGELMRFYKPTTKYEVLFDDGKKFRKMADEILGVRAPAFITACVARDKDGIAKSDIKILWPVPAVASK